MNATKYAVTASSLLISVPFVITYFKPISKTIKRFTSAKKRNMHKVIQYLKSKRKAALLLHIDPNYTISRI